MTQFLVTLGVLAAVLLLTWLMGRAAGTRGRDIDQARRDLQGADERRRLEEEVRDAHPDELEELRQKWTEGTNGSQRPH